jgi:hypothetical protein
MSMEQLVKWKLVWKTEVLGSNPPPCHLYNVTHKLCKSPGSHIAVFSQPNTALHEQTHAYE